MYIAFSIASAKASKVLSQLLSPASARVPFNQTQIDISSTLPCETCHNTHVSALTFAHLPHPSGKSNLTSHLQPTLSSARLPAKPDPVNGPQTVPSIPTPNTTPPTNADPRRSRQHEKPGALNALQLFKSRIQIRVTCGRSG